jgi:hypothetical protein
LQLETLGRGGEERLYLQLETRERVQKGGGGGEEEEFFNHYKHDLERHAHTPSGVAGAELKSQSGGALGTPTLSRFSPPYDVHDTPTQP